MLSGVTLECVLQENGLQLGKTGEGTAIPSEIPRQALENPLYVTGTDFTTRLPKEAVSGALDCGFKLQLGRSETASQDDLSTVTICSVLYDNFGNIVSRQKSKPTIRVYSGQPALVGAGMSIQLKETIDSGIVGIAILEGDYTKNDNLKLISFITARVSWKPE